MKKKPPHSSSTSRAKGSDIWQKDKDHVIHPYTDFSTFQTEGSHVISSASGCYVTDIEGNRYLLQDFGVPILGIAIRRWQMR